MKIYNNAGTEYDTAEIWDAWPLAMKLRDAGETQESEALLGLWHLAHAMRDALERQAETKAAPIAYWNTGRMYSRQGQRIVARLRIDQGIPSRCFFYDIDRLIAGSFDWPEGLDFQAFAADQVMAHYDQNRYDSTMIKPFTTAELDRRHWGD